VRHKASFEALYML